MEAGVYYEGQLQRILSEVGGGRCDFHPKLCPDGRRILTNGGYDDAGKQQIHLFAFTLNGFRKSPYAPAELPAP
jgi:hypothetical protein